MRNEPFTALRDMRRLYDIRIVLGLSANRRVIVCPLPQHKHSNNTPSFSIFVSHESTTQKWRCHGSCGLEGDVLDLVGYLHIPGYDKRNGEHVKAALALLSGTTAINPPKPETTKKPQLPNGMYKRFLPAGAEVLKYAGERFLTSETLERFHVGQHCSGTAIWMTMPTLHGEQLRGIKMRNTCSRTKKDRYSNMPGSINGLFNYNGVNNTAEPVLIVKGEIAVMILAQHGILACAPTGGEGAYFKHEELLMPLAFAARRVVIGDNDDRPDVREKMVQAARRRAEIFKAHMKLPPDPYVGVDDFLLAEPNNAIPTIKSWME